MISYLMMTAFKLSVYVWIRDIRHSVVLSVFLKRAVDINQQYQRFHVPHENEAGVSCLKILIWR